MPARRPPPASVRPGAVVASRFQLERQLGQGSMGSVWRARHLGLQTTVAIKFMAPELGQRPDLIRRFAHEARAAAQIKSPHVVGVLDFGTDDEGRSYIAMEYLRGEDLGADLDRKSKLPLADVARVVRQAALGLTKAHAAGVIHRDIKPENLFLAHDDGEIVVKILDFGVAKLDAGSSPHQTQFGQTLGSPVYMSPEQAQGYPIDARSDLFSLGVVAYQCLTGRVPFEGWTVAEVFDSLLADTPTPPSRRVAGLPPSVDQWVERALQKDPAKRFQTAADMADALLACLAAPPEATLSRVIISAQPPREAPTYPSALVPLNALARPAAPPTYDAQARPAPPSHDAQARPAPPTYDAPARFEPPAYDMPARHAPPARDTPAAPVATPARNLRRYPSQPPDSTQPSRGASVPLPSPAELEGPLRRVLDLLDVYAIAVLASDGRQLASLQSTSAPDVPAERVFQAVHALAQAEGERLGNDRSVLLRFDYAVVMAYRSGDYRLIALATEYVNVVLLRVLLQATARRVRRLGAPAPRPSLPSLGPHESPRGARRAQPPAEATGFSAGVWLSPSVFLSSESGKRPSAPPPMQASTKTTPTPAWQQNALVVMRLSLALGKYLGAGAHRVVKQEMVRLQTANEYQSFLELLDALGAFVEDPAGRDAFFHEGRAIIASAPRDAGR